MTNALPKQTKPGRLPTHESNVARQRAYRDNKAKQIAEALQLLQAFSDIELGRIQQRGGITGRQAWAEIGRRQGWWLDLDDEEKRELKRRTSKPAPIAAPLSSNIIVLLPRTSARGSGMGNTTPG